MRNIGNELIKGMREAVDYVDGKKPKGARIRRVLISEKIDVKKVREQIGVTQEEFAAKLGISPRTIQHWEQGDRRPQGPARVLLTLLGEHPRSIERMLSELPKSD